MPAPLEPGLWPVPALREQGSCLEPRRPCSSGAGCELNPLRPRAGAKTRSAELPKWALEHFNKKASDSLRPRFNTVLTKQTLPPPKPCGLSIPPHARVKVAMPPGPTLGSACVEAWPAPPAPPHQHSGQTHLHCIRSPPHCATGNGVMGCKVGGAEEGMLGNGWDEHSVA